MQYFISVAILKNGNKGTEKYRETMMMRKTSYRSNHSCSVLKMTMMSLAGLLISAVIGELAFAAPPEMSRLQVTDITTRSFSVVLTVSEPASTLLSLFAADCTTAVTGFTVAQEQHLVSGNRRISVTALTPSTNYCYQLTAISTATSEVATITAAPVTTATEIVRTSISGVDIIPANNDIVKAPAVHLATGESRDAIISTVELTGGGAVAPLSLLLSADQNRDYFNLNNLFATATGKTLKVAGSERVKVTENHGSSGCIIERFRQLPAASGGTAAGAFVQANTTDIDASGGVNILDVLRIVGGKGTSSTGQCFNSDLDLSSNGVVDANDLIIIKGGFNGL